MPIFIQNNIFIKPTIRCLIQFLNLIIFFSIEYRLKHLNIFLVFFVVIKTPTPTHTHTFNTLFSSYKLIFFLDILFNDGIISLVKITIIKLKLQNVQFLKQLLYLNIISHGYVPVCRSSFYLSTVFTTIMIKNLYVVIFYSKIGRWKFFRFHFTARYDAFDVFK